MCAGGNDHLPVCWCVCLRHQGMQAYPQLPFSWECTEHPHGTQKQHCMIPVQHEPHFHYCIPRFFILSFVVREIEP